MPVIRGSNLSEDPGVRLVDDGLVFIDEALAGEFSRSVVVPGDLVFTCWGTVGQVGLIDDRARYPRYVISNKQMKLTPDPTKVDSLFLYYSFSGPDLGGQVRRNAIGSSVPGFNLGQLRGLRLRLPPLRTQRHIARILSALDDKIDLNREMNRTLEAMAQAIFRSWFVDFDPVVAKSEGREPFGMDAGTAALFPDRFVKSELGPIPEGWEVVRMDAVAKTNKNGVKPFDFPEEDFEHYSIPAFDDGRTPSVEAGSEIKSLKYQVHSGAVLVSKLNPKTPRVWLPDLHSTRRAIASTEFLVLTPRQGVSSEFLYCLNAQIPFQADVATLATGTTGSRQRVKPEAYASMPVTRPPRKVIEVFTGVARPMLALANANTRECQTLAALRDLLLPKLLSGEIRIPEAAEMVEDVA